MLMNSPIVILQFKSLGPQVCGPPVSEINASACIIVNVGDQLGDI